MIPIMINEVVALKFIKKLYHNLFVSTSVGFLISNAMAAANRLLAVFRLRDIEITDVMSIGLSSFVEDADFISAYHPNSKKKLYNGIAAVSRKNYLRRTHDPSVRQNVVILNFQGVRLSSIPLDSSRAHFYAAFICLMSSHLKNLSFLILEHRLNRSFKECVLRSVADCSLYIPESSLPNIDFVFTKKLTSIRSICMDADYYLGTYGTDATIAIMSGTPSTIVSSGYYVTREAFEDSDFSADSLSFIQFLNVTEKPNLSVKYSLTQALEPSEFERFVPKIISHIKGFVR